MANHCHEPVSNHWTKPTEKSQSSALLGECLRWWGGDGAIEGREWGHEEAMFGSEVSSRLLWNAQLWTQLHQQEVDAVLGCSLPLWGRQGAGKGAWAQSRKTSVSLMPGTARSVSQNHCFSSWSMSRNAHRSATLFGIRRGLKAFYKW